MPPGSHGSIDVLPRKNRHTASRFLDPRRFVRTRALRKRQREQLAFPFARMPVETRPTCPPSVAEFQNFRCRHIQLGRATAAPRMPDAVPANAGGGLCAHSSSEPAAPEWALGGGLQPPPAAILVEHVATREHHDDVGSAEFIQADAALAVRRPCAALDTRELPAGRALGFRQMRCRRVLLLWEADIDPEHGAMADRGHHEHEGGLDWKDPVAEEVRQGPSGEQHVVQAHGIAQRPREPSEAIPRGNQQH
mmetsp:Transcript_90254/g.260115  ORF Transcript_90254/g.260115 Transcript_90254/m.260115 type:complete len:250 (-) Transcript_90254:244-993(-)